MRQICRQDSSNNSYITSILTSPPPPPHPTPFSYLSWGPSHSLHPLSLSSSGTSSLSHPPLPSLSVSLCLSLCLCLFVSVSVCLSLSLTITLTNSDLHTHTQTLPPTLRKKLIKSSSAHCWSMLCLSGTHTYSQKNIAKIEAVQRQAAHFVLCPQSV